ncbi:MAG: hypothetical protein HKN80_06665 [Acidimicrobiia bacterium]|nr:hypothetical protein [Acidimicrobiia bacterium]
MTTRLRVGLWVSPPVILAVGFIERLRGLRPHSDGRALLLRGRSVHSIGMKESLWVVGLDREGVAIETRLLRPGRFRRIRRAIWMLEFSAAEPPPPIGSTLRRVTGNG